MCFFSNSRKNDEQIKVAICKVLETTAVFIADEEKFVETVLRPLFLCFPK